jgi:hypothetical protein
LTIQEFQNQDDWTCPYCHETTGRFFKKIHYRCLPEEKKKELQIIEESKFETCQTCNKRVDPYYKNYHVCEANSSTNTNLKFNPPSRRNYRLDRWRRFRYRTWDLQHGTGLSDFMRHKAVLEGEWWILYIDGKRIGPVEKATKEELTSWDPKADEKH